MKQKKERLNTVIFEPDGRRVRTATGNNIFEVACNAGVKIRSECGGNGICGKCRIIVRDKKAVTKITKVEKNHLSSSEIDLDYRLACCTVFKKNVTVMIPQESRIGIQKIQETGLERPVPLTPLVAKWHIALAKPTLADIRPDYERILDSLKDEYGLDKLEIEYELLRNLPNTLRHTNWDITVTLWNGHRIIAVEKGDTSTTVLGCAIDVGTSKIVGCVVDLTTGKTIGVASIENPQVIYGEDIVSRIAFATDDEENLGTLQRLIFQGINDVLHEACVQAEVDSDNIYEATIGGNTAMHHFFLGVQPKYLALSPFTPVLKRSMDVKASQVNIKINPEGNVHVLPVIAGFVGADAVAGVLSSGIYESEELSLLLDIGTNTEVFVGNSEDLLACSCASGPAFEGGHIKHGMKAVTGAIEKVYINPASGYDVEYETVDDADPSGLCGSAMVDVVAELAKCGIINRRGRFNMNVNTPRLRFVDNKGEFILAWNNETATGKEITVTQEDINEIQLAKAAIFTGCWILMKKQNVKNKDLDQVFLAGAFGSYINPESAKLIGLVPDVPTEKIKFVGNTALTGTKMALISQEARKIADKLSNRIRFLELSVDPDFSSEFANAMFIPHKDLNRFPSIKKIFQEI